MPQASALLAAQPPRRGGPKSAWLRALLRQLEAQEAAAAAGSHAGAAGALAALAAAAHAASSAPLGGESYETGAGEEGPEVTGRRRRRGGGGLPAQRGGKRRRGSGEAARAGSGGVAAAASEAAAASGAAAAESGSPAPARRQSRQGPPAAGPADGVVISAAAEAAGGGKSSSKPPKDHPSRHFMPDGRLLSQLSAAEAQAVLAAEPRRKVCIEESTFAATASGINNSLRLWMQKHISHVRGLFQYDDAFNSHRIISD